MIKRREFLKWLAALFTIIFSGCINKGEEAGQETVKEGEQLKRATKSEVFVIKTSDRGLGIKELMKRLDVGTGKRIAMKANYNSADEFPASTHIDTVSALIRVLKENGASVVLAERSGMGNTREVLEDMGVMELAGKEGFDVVVLDDLKSSEWAREKQEHWKQGFLFPKVFRDADAIIQTCCLKTHRYGGHFTMSLKNSVGMVAKYDPDDGYSYMSELHSSRYQRVMIAEINAAYEPAFVIMDGIAGFSKGGPDTGTLIEPGIMLASKDRVAIDAAGVAVLRIYGTTSEVSKGDIFEQEQIARAAELGLGASSPDEIEVVAVNEEASGICSRIAEELQKK
ncbi:MAG: DUF362 domain-containing protein [Candidatus Methanoperedens sp.]|nr:DUF362 domain-containing protein [Candidatus Methanoperedens sp.]MCZ7403524.1 DUF362 domain-containing protein [Candidatus Methanoperedens sp.]